MTTSALSGLTNWAGNYAYTAARLHEPASLDELQTVVRAVPRLRVLGSRHAFNDIADTTGDLVSLARMPKIVELDRSDTDVMTALRDSRDYLSAL